MGRSTMNASPSRMSCTGFPRAVLVTRGTFSRHATATMTRNPAAATKNADAGFSVSDQAMMNPAAAGARMRVPGQIEEFNATALIMNCRSTRCGNIERRAGWSNASTRAGQERNQQDMPHGGLVEQRQEGQQ